MNPDSDNPTCWLWSEVSPGMQSGKVVAQKVSIADARRLVTCWNEHDDLVKERDELVVALRDLFLNGYSATRIEKVGDLLSKYPEAS